VGGEKINIQEGRRDLIPIFQMAPRERKERKPLSFSEEESRRRTPFLGST